uniref:Cystatin domain-containing protein n=1 Tax=Strongyloides papillosus TaxID=174720 RepID=A0A0N5B730_STREA
MNYLNVSIFIIATFLIVVETFPSFHKQRELFKMKQKDPKNKKIIKLAKQSVAHYNRKYNMNSRFAGVLKAKKEHTTDSSHYVLVISTMTDCGGNELVCLEEIHSDVYKNKKNPTHLSFYVHKEGSPDYR